MTFEYGEKLPDNAEGYQEILDYSNIPEKEENYPEVGEYDIVFMYDVVAESKVTVDEVVLLGDLCHRK